MERGLMITPAHHDSLLAVIEGSLSIDEAARRHGVTPAEVERWRASYVSGLRQGARGRRPRATWVAVAAALAVVLGTADAWAQSTSCAGFASWPNRLWCFIEDRPARASEVNANFKVVSDISPPVGSIIAWHKSLTGVPALPGSWVECDGRTISDVDSPLNGRQVPNLNTGRFLRGAGTSGTLQDDALQEHRHELNAGTTIDLLRNVHPSGNRELYSSDQANLTGVGAGYYDIYVTVAPIISAPVGIGTNAARTATETRPSNMSVVWIIRIK